MTLKLVANMIMVNLMCDEYSTVIILCYMSSTPLIEHMNVLRAPSVHSAYVPLSHFLQPQS